jgi:hypothetical protein
MLPWKLVYPSPPQYHIWKEVCPLVSNTNKIIQQVVYTDHIDIPLSLPWASCSGHYVTGRSHSMPLHSGILPCKKYPKITIWKDTIVEANLHLEGNSNNHPGLEKHMDYIPIEGSFSQRGQCDTSDNWYQSCHHQRIWYLPSTSPSPRVPSSAMFFQHLHSNNPFAKTKGWWLHHSCLLTNQPCQKTTFSHQCHPTIRIWVLHANTNLPHPGKLLREEQRKRAPWPW